MTRAFRRRGPRLAAWTPPHTDEPERPYSITDQDRDEHTAALNHDPSSYRRIGGALVDVYDAPDPDDAA